MRILSEHSNVTPRWARLVSALAIVASLAVRHADAGTLSGGAGFDYQTGPDAQSYRSMLLFGTAQGGAGDITLAGIRYGDSQLGPGVGLFANGAVQIVPRVLARAVGLRAIGDGAYRAWRDWCSSFLPCSRTRRPRLTRTLRAHSAPPGIA